MKTPMQEVYENFNLMSDKEFKAWMLNTDLLEKEKEVMCEFAFNCGDEIKDQNNWRSPRNLTNYEVIQDCYNETFNTNEK